MGLREFPFFHFVLSWQGLCHHDFSPENVVISSDGTAAVVTDFGMVQRMPTDASGEILAMRDTQPFGKNR